MLSPVAVDSTDTAYFGTLSDAVFGYYAVADGAIRWNAKIPEGVRAHRARIRALVIDKPEGPCEGPRF